MSIVPQITRTEGICLSEICVEQRKISTCRKSERYKNWYFCIKCRTNFPKTLNRCPCCGFRLRTRCRKKTPYRK